VDIDLHFVRERAAISEVRVVHVPSTSQFTDVFIKGTFFSLLEVRSHGDTIAGPC
jgi:hypothetical protein